MLYILELVLQKSVKFEYIVIVYLKKNNSDATIFTTTAIMILFSLSWKKDDAVDENSLSFISTLA